MGDSQTILVTGASSGLGRLTSETLARRGHRVFASMRDVDGSNAGAAAGLRAIAQQEGVSLEIIELDVTSDTSVDEAVAAVVDHAGSIDVVVNNAGVMAVGLDEAFTVEEMRRLFDVNVFGPQRVIRAVLPHMRSRGEGLLIAVSSNMAQITFPFAGMYTATKRALEGLAESYRYQLSPLGIDSVIVEPGGYPTPLYARLVYPTDEERVSSYGELAEMPGQVFGGFADQLQGPDGPDPQDVADAIADLIETPAGQRPVRTVVDPFTAEAVNALSTTSVSVQEQTFAGFGMSDLLSVSPES